MFVVYPFVFKKESPQGYFIESVDVKEAYTGVNTDDISFGISMAEEVLGLVLSEYVERGIELPKATPIKNVKTKNDEFVTLIKIDLEKFLKDKKLFHISSCHSSSFPQGLPNLFYQNKKEAISLIFPPNRSLNPHSRYTHWYIVLHNPILR